MKPEPDMLDAEVETVKLTEQFPPEKRIVSFDMGLGEFEPVETDYTTSTIVFRCSANQPEEVARAKAQAVLGERYGATKAFRTARYWVFFIES